jgi:hypothetical protein
MKALIASVVTLFLVCGMAAQAHEIGTTKVSAVLHGSRYAIEIATDADALAEKLRAIGGPAFNREELLLSRLQVAFDGTGVQPSIEYTVTPAPDANSAALATIRLAGDIPEGAREFTWTYAWTFASYSLSVRNADAPEPAVVWLEGGDTSAPFAVGSDPLIRTDSWGLTPWQTAWRYLVLGFTHIVPHGLDHMLFVLGLFLLSGPLTTVLWQVSAFTLAHSLTLALGIYGVITAPPALVEPLIAISIAYVAIENIFLRDLKPWRVSLVFAFGLLHGMGFAGVLQEIGLPRAEFLTALVTFNAGVELGQLAVIGAAFLLVGWRSGTAWYRGRVVVPASIAIACTAIYWTIERLA